MSRYMIKYTWLEELYTPAKNYLNLRLNGIIADNNLLNKDALVHGELMYKGRFYESFVDPAPTIRRYYTIYTLHPNLEDKMETYLVDRREISKECEIIDRFLSVILTKLSWEDEIHELFGDNLYNLVRYLPTTITKQPGLSEEELYTLAIKYRAYIDIMRNRMIDNLLAKDLYNAKS